MSYVVKSELKNGWNSNSIEFDTYEEAKSLFDDKVYSNNYCYIQLLLLENDKYTEIESYNDIN